MMMQGQHTRSAARTSFVKLLVEEGLLYPVINSLYHYVCYQINFITQAAITSF